MCGMKKILLLGAGLLLASCAPTQGQKPMRYQGTSSAILSAISEIAGSIQASPAHNFYSVTQVTPTQVTLRADATTAFQVLGANVPITVIFTALESSGTTLVTHEFRSEVRADANSPAGRAIQNIYSELARRFTPLP